MLFDTHCHLDVEDFSTDRAAVLSAAHKAGVHDLVLPAIDFSSWPRIDALCRAHLNLHPAFGLHPMFLERHREAHLASLPHWIERRRPVAVGECGLDFFAEGLDPDRQRALLLGQLQVARDFGLPVILHARRAIEEMIVTLRRIGGLSGVIHSYSGSEEQARQLFDMGFMIGLGGPLTYDRAQRLHRLVKSMPLEHLVLETDAPDQPDCDWRGQRNEPARLPIVAQKVAELRELSVEDVARITSDNARRLFNLPAPA